MYVKIVFFSSYMDVFVNLPFPSMTYHYKLAHQCDDSFFIASHEQKLAILLRTVLHSVCIQIHKLIYSLSAKVICKKRPRISEWNELIVLFV